MSHPDAARRFIVGLLLRAQRAGYIDRLLHGGCRSSSGQLHGERQQMRAVPLLQLT